MLLKEEIDKYLHYCKLQKELDDKEAALNKKIKEQQTNKTK